MTEKNKTLSHVHLREKEFLEGNPIFLTKDTIAVEQNDLDRLLVNLRTKYSGRELQTQSSINAREYHISANGSGVVLGHAVEYEVPDKRQVGARSMSLDIIAESGAKVLEIYRILAGKSA